MAAIEKPYRSNEMVGGWNNAGNRTLLYALGVDESELKKPFTRRWSRASAPDREAAR